MKRNSRSRTQPATWPAFFSGLVEWPVVSTKTQLKLAGARPARDQTARAQGALLQGVAQKVSGIKDARINHHAGLHKNANSQLRFSGSTERGDEKQAN